MEELNEVVQEQPKKHSFLYDIYSLLHDLVYILAGITLVFVFCVRLVGVSGESMMPTLHDGDYLALQSNVIMGELEFGDIIVAREPTFRNGEPIVKRVIATEGQYVEIRRDEQGIVRVYVDGIRVDDSFILEPMDGNFFDADNDNDSSKFSITVSKNCIFVLGDNRNNSADSRYPDIGEISVDQVMGKVIFRVLPGADANGERDYSRIGTVS